jgi:hypothetical protein
MVFGPNASGREGLSRVDEADDRRRRWIEARELTPDQYMLVNFGHCHEEWQDNVDEARRDEIRERLSQAERTGLLSSLVVGDMRNRLVGDPTALELELESAGIPDVYVPRTS